MTSNVHIFDYGKRLMAERIAGDTLKSINGMYLEYSDTPLVDLEYRDVAYFSQLKKRPHSGYGRVAVKDIHVIGDGSIQITGIFSCSDLKGGRLCKDSRLEVVTLAYMQDDIEAKDGFIASVKLTTPMKLIKGAAMSVTITLNLE